MSGPEEKRTRRALAAAWNALDAWAKGRPLAAALAEAMRAEKELGPKEKRTATQVARRIVRDLRRIDLALALATEAVGVPMKSVSPADRTVLRYLALRVFLEKETTPRVLQELRLPSAPRACGLGEPRLRLIGEKLPTPETLPVPEDPVRALALRRSVTDALARRLAAELGLERADAVLEALNRPPRWDLRVNRLLASRQEAATRLAADGATVGEGALSPDALVADDRAGLFGQAHRAGLYEVQDEGSQLIALACGAKAGETAIDFCAGSGGKSLALAPDVAPGGAVWASDAVAGRLDDLPDRARRAKATKLVHVAGREPPFELREKADVVLVDAPCSGVGSLRREVDLRWRLTEAELDSYPPRQLEILTRAAAFVRPGGRLVYGTCSPLRAECESVVEAFLRENPAYSRVDARETLPAPAHAAVEDGFLRTWPDRHDTGAFFAAVLRRER